MLRSKVLRSEVIECSGCLMAEGGPTTLLFVEQTNVATNPRIQEHRVLGHINLIVVDWVYTTSYFLVCMHPYLAVQCYCAIIILHGF